MNKISCFAVISKDNERGEQCFLSSVREESQDSVLTWVTSGEVMLHKLVQSSCRHSSSITKCHEGRKVLLGRVERKEFKISTKRVKKRQDREEHSWMNKERKNNDGKKKLETKNIKSAGRNRRWHVRQKVKIPWVMEILSFSETHSTQVSHLISLSSLFPLTY